MKFKILYVILFQIFVLFFKNIRAELINEVDYDLLPKLVKIDRYDSCKLGKSPQKYCVIDVIIQPISNSSNHIWELIQILNNDLRNFRHDNLRRGLCLDARNRTAQKEYDYYVEVLNYELGVSGLEVANITDVTCNHFYKKFDRYDVLGASIVVFITIFVLLSTYIDVAVFKDLPNTKLSLGLRCLRSFSITKNWPRLQATNNSKENLQFIQGMRFLSIGLIVFGHIILFLVSSPIENTYFLEKEYHIFTNGFIMNGAVIVQTYFWLSGMFVGYGIFKYMAKHKFQIKILVNAIFLRYIRLIPSFGIITLVSATILYHMGEGPFWEKTVGFDRNNCRQNWWANFLLVSNELHSNQTCLVNGWYVSADFQLFLMSLFVLTLIWIKREWVLKILGTLFVISILVPGIITYIYELDPLPLAYLETLKYVFANDRTYHMTYLQPYNNASTYILGLIMGYFLHTGDIVKLPFPNKWFLVILHFIAWSAATVVLLGGYIFYTEYYEPNRIIAALFASVYKLIFILVPIVVTWLIKSGHGDPYKRVLEWKIFVVLGRLSFTIYLVHWPLLRIMSGMDMVPVYHSFYNIIAVRFASVLIISILLAILLALFVEFPLSALIKTIGESFKKDTKHRNVNTKNVVFNSSDKILYS